MLSLILQINYHLPIDLCYARWKLSQLLVPSLTRSTYSVIEDITSTSFLLKYSWFWGAFLVAQMVTNLPATQETQVQFSCWEDPMEKGMATHSSILVWRIPWTEEPGRLQSMGSQRVWDNWVINNFTFIVYLHYCDSFRRTAKWFVFMLTYTFFQIVSVIGHYAAAESRQSCPTLCDPIDGSPPGSPVPGTLQARTLGWVTISFSNAWKWKVKVKSLSRVWLFATPWTAAFQAPPPMGFSRQEYWSGVPVPSPIGHYKII